MIGAPRILGHRPPRPPLRTAALAALVMGVVMLSGCTPAGHPVSHSTTPAATHSARPTPAGSGSPPPVPVAIPGSTAWAGYHADQARTGAVVAGLPLAPIRAAWTADLGGAVYGQPVVAAGRVIAVTETDRVVALDPASGRVAWSVSLGSPLTGVDSVAGCGNIDPLGITSTPVIDTANGIVFAVGEVSTGGGVVHHQLVGLKVATGQVVLSEAVDPPLPPGESPLNLLQRASLALANGRVYIGFGGNYGDCGAYHGWVVGVDESGPPDPVTFEAASDGQGGAVWQGGGAPAIDASGNLYVTTGNANPDPPAGGPDPLRYTESVVKLSPALQPIASFKDQIAGGDEDLSTGNPVLLPGGALFAVGKTDVGYVLARSDLARMASIQGICGGDPGGGPAYDATTNRLFVPCHDGGIQQVDLSSDSVGPRLGGSNGAPIVVGATLWAAQYPDGTISQYDVATGALLQRIGVGSTIPTFTTPSVALGRLFIGTTSGVAAFEGPR